jgi:PAS domain S-box-containing protein
MTTRGERDAVPDGTLDFEAAPDALQLAALVEASDDAIIGKTPAGVVTSWNGGAHRIFGYAADEIVGQPISLLIPADREGEEPEILRRLSAGEGPQRFETVRRRKDGVDIHVSVTSSPVRDSAGRLIGVSKVARDITAKRRAEEAIRHARDEAENANRELEALSYSVAHDLRAPLRGMNGFAQILLDSHRDKLDAEAQDYLEEILLNAKKMAALIDSLLALSRLSRGGLRRESVDLSALVRASAAQLARTGEPRTVDLVVQDGLKADLDPALARALVDNLVGNAWKFTTKVAAARIEFDADEEDGVRTFHLSDNGAGFDMAFANKLFAPFQRLHGTDEFPGSGVGLATVQRIVRRHGGRVWAEGAVGRGATFHFVLPVSGSGEAP